MTDDPHLCRRRADELLDLAAKAVNLAERGRLIDQALQWHNRAKLLEGDPGAELDGFSSLPSLDEG